MAFFLNPVKSWKDRTTIYFLILATYKMPWLVYTLFFCNTHRFISVINFIGSHLLVFYFLLLNIKDNGHKPREGMFLHSMSALHPKNLQLQRGNCVLLLTNEHKG